MMFNTTAANPSLPDSGTLRKAVEIFLRIAYPDGAIPSDVQKRIAPVMAADPSAPALREWFEASTERESGCSFCLRLGQKHYPHMKLMLQPSPDRLGYLFFADSHDRHLFSAIGSEAAALADLRQANGLITREIEKQWESAGIATFQSYLRRSLIAPPTESPRQP